MDRRKFLAASVMGAAVPVAGRAEAGGGSGQGIVGSYFGTVTATNPPLGQFSATPITV